jgi:hypothetical protein
VAARANPQVFATYFCIFRISLQMKVVPKSTNTPEKPTRENLINLRINSSVKKDCNTMYNPQNELYSYSKRNV